MDIQAEKQILIDLINQIKDVEIIEQIKKIIIPLKEKSYRAQLSESETKALQEGIEDFKKGNVISHEDVMKPYVKYLQ